MAATYVNVTAAEMRDYLEARGFKQYGKDGVPDVPGGEIAWGKVFKYGKGHISIRVYSGINKHDHQSRAKGKDAIRVMVFFRDCAGNVRTVGGSKRVHRVENWRGNLQSRIDAWEDTIAHKCPDCGAPMALRKVKKAGPNQGREFYSCLDKSCNKFLWREN